MGKITVKHYLNKRIKIKDDDKIEYPVYVRIIYNRRNTNFKSEIITKELLTEAEFENDTEVQREKQYEIEIVNSIINWGIKQCGDDFPISRVYEYIHIWKRGLYLEFWGFLPRKKILKKIINFIHEKTSIKLDIIDQLLKYNDTPHIDYLIELADQKIIDEHIGKKAIYIKAIYEYEKINYGDNNRIYGADNSFCYYEWEDLHKKDEFINFLKAKNSLTEDEIMNITKEFDNTLHERILNEMDFPAHIVHSKRNDTDIWE